MERFWVYLDNKVVGPVDIPSLRKLNGFNLLTQVCAEGQEAWRMADEVIEIKAYFAAPPRANSLAPEPQIDLPTVIKPQIEMSLPMAAAAAGSLETLPDMPSAAMAGNAAPQPSAAGGLRVLCAACGYKNPRDVPVCMKCGAAVKSTDIPSAEKSSASNVPGPYKNPFSVKLEEAGASQPAPAAAAATAPTPVIAAVESPMVDIPVKRIAVILSGIVLLGGSVFGVRHLWKAKHRSKASQAVVVTSVPKPLPPSSAKDKKSAKSKSNVLKASLPGLAATPEKSGTQETENNTRDAGRGTRKEDALNKERPSPESRAPRPASPSETASYTVINQAYPLQHRTPAPVDSKYAEKRRGDKALWASKEGQAIQMAMRHRIYGGLRTVGRNADILMQVLRDREYISAFENGKRQYLFNDADWAAGVKETPVYEVRLTFSGGKEADGSPRTPLRFAFNVDLERQTVEPGGYGMIKANTMHAFFDESRIPPEERRSVAKDTEELVQAAQPGASPLALETVTKQYAATYSIPALQRVADVYGLTLVTKKLARNTSSMKDLMPDAAGTTMTQPKKESKVTGEAAKKQELAPSASGAIQYSMEKIDGKDRRVTAQVPSKATPAKLWETFTSYDRLSQFVPDVLISRREGQDGPAVIVHTVSLTRLMFFVFKVNLHLRIIEHPQQYRLEFERIAGDFEKFNGYVEMKADPTNTRSTMNVHLTLAPKGYVPNWALQGMAKHFLVPVLDAIRAKAESY